MSKDCPAARGPGRTSPAHRHRGFVIITQPGDPAVQGQTGGVHLSDLSSRQWVHYTPESGPAEIILPHFPGLLLLPDPPVRRPLTA
jgi:hypothetical protein